MKTIRNIIVVGAALLGMAACTKNFEEINTNPNKVNYGDIQAYNCYEPIFYGMGYQTQKLCQYYNNELIQMTAFTGGSTQHVKEYIVTEGNWQTLWDNYARYGGDCQHMITLAREKGDKYYEALGLILKVCNLSTLADLFGDIPYREAYQYSENRTPAFESQADLPELFVADLDSAVTLLKAKPTVTKSGLDQLYGDSYTKWIRFANSLRMRILCRYSGMDASYWSEIQKMIDNSSDYLVMASNSDNAYVPFQAQDPYMSYWGQSNADKTSFENYRMTEQVIKMMVEFNATGSSILVDPRLAVFARKPGKDWVGVVSGCLAADTNNEEKKTPSRIDYSVMATSSFPSFIMDFSEVLFIEAEGVERGLLTVPGQTAKSLYESAIRANIEKWKEIGESGATVKKVRSIEVEQLMASSLASYDKAAAGDGTSIYGSALELILSQKYLSLFYCGFEQFSEWRRTEYPILTIGEGTGTNDYELPTRMGYPNYTMTSNRANAQAALARMDGENDMHTPLDWSYKKQNGSHRNPYVQK